MILSSMEKYFRIKTLRKKVLILLMQFPKASKQTKAFIETILVSGIVHRNHRFLIQSQAI